MKKIFRTIISETLKGESLVRTLQNLSLSEIEIEGNVADLGSKSKNSSYYRFIKSKPNTNIIFTDFNPREEGILKIDLEGKFQIESFSKDFLLLNNVLEHLFNYQNCIDECFRILKKDGYLVGVVPFLYRVHLDPDDYFRYTESSLMKIFGNAGFSNILIKPLGFGPMSAGASQYAKVFKIKFIAIIYIISISVDKILNKIFKNNKSIRSNNFPLSYLFICKK